MICSSYQDIIFPETVNNVDKCVDKAKAIGKEIIIGTDSNAHSQLRMSNQQMLEEKSLKTSSLKTTYLFQTPETNTLMIVPLAIQLLTLL